MPSSNLEVDTGEGGAEIGWGAALFAPALAALPLGACVVVVSRAVYGIVVVAQPARIVTAPATAKSPRPTRES
jgi:hypothetical protein